MQGRGATLEQFPAVLCTDTLLDIDFSLGFYFPLLPLAQYIPQLASAIVRGNKQDSSEQPIQLKGFLVGER